MCIIEVYTRNIDLGSDGSVGILIETLKLVLFSYTNISTRLHVRELYKMYLVGRVIR